MKLFIEGRRDGYSPEQCYKTMTVGELINFLNQYDEDTEVYLKNDNGYTYGSINENSFEEYKDEIEDYVLDCIARYNNNPMDFMYAIMDKAALTDEKAFEYLNEHFGYKYDEDELKEVIEEYHRMEG